MATKTSTVLRLGELAAIARSVAVGELAAALIGTLVGGLGGRLVMRFSALADPDAAGLITEAGNRVGEITPEGTLELVLFGGLFGGLFAAVVWLAIRPWMEPLGEWRSIVAGLVAVAATSSLVIEGGNPDFSRLDPRWLNITMFLVLLFAAGVLVAELDQSFMRRFPVARYGWTVLYGALALLLVPVAVQAFLSYFTSDARPLRMIGWFLGLAGLSTISGGSTRSEQGQRWNRASGCGCWAVSVSSGSGPQASST